MLVKIDWTPAPRALRTFGFAMLGGFVLVGLLFGRLLLGSTPAMLACFAAGVFFALVSLVPPAGIWPYRAWMGFSWVLGLFFAPLVLGAVYFLVFTPIALAMRLAGRDALALRRPPQGASMWRPIRHRTDVRSYERQF